MLNQSSLSTVAGFAGALLLCTAASAQTLVVLHDFSGPDGSFPTGPLVQGLDGKFYGSTAAGGASFGKQCKDRGCGTVFNIGRYGALTTLYSFCAQNATCPDGAEPYEALAEGTFGSFFGVARGGGVNTQGRPGAGVIFRVTPGLSETTLYAFCSLTNCSDGVAPDSIIEGWDGSFYGTTSAGGYGDTITSAAPCSDAGGCGTVFRLTPAGRLATSYTFCKGGGSCPDGFDPQGLIQGTDGNLYGFSAMGGIQAGPFFEYPELGAGTIFKISGSSFTTIYRFCAQTSCSDGATPLALVQGADGTLYGVTLYGGAGVSGDSYGSGTIFKLTTDGTLTTLYTFCKSGPGCSDGVEPNSLVEGSDENFYGTTSGTVFEMTPDGKFKTIYSLLAYEGNPNSLLQGVDGAFYGTAWGGGKTGRGTIFRLDTGLGPFVHPVLAFGKVGATVMIEGIDLTGTTEVSFNGTPAAFKVDSATSITTTVPSGAATGSIAVTTPGGKLTSNVSFTVLP
jgi:uncharacterized repeat protein (TIGR03803 family)